MTKNEQDRGEPYQNFQDFLDRHGRPSRGGSDDMDVDESHLGSRLAQAFLAELRKKLSPSQSKGHGT